jgi:very-short-patch-repair endonuclease
VARLSILVDSYRETLPPHSAYSHLSAALLWGLPVTRHVQDRAEVIRTGRSVAYRQMLVRKRSLPESDVTVLDGTRVTTVARTLSDVAHDYPLDVSVPMIDAALRNGLVTGDLTALFPPSHPGRRGARRARHALSIADPSHESPAESICAVRLHEHGIDGFVTQVTFGSPDGAFRARVDFLHRAAKLILEVNGEIKYVDSEAGSRRARQERQRDYRLRNLGYRVYQLTWADLFSPDVFREIRRLVHASTPASG